MPVFKLSLKIIKKKHTHYGNIFSSTLAISIIVINIISKEQESSHLLIE